MMELNKHPSELDKFANDQLVDFFQELHSYLRAREQYPILNCEKLISLLKVSCSFLLDPRSRASLFINLVGSHWVQFTISGHDSNGNKIHISFSDGFQSFITEVFSDLTKCLDSTGFEILVELLNTLIQHPAIDIQHKFAVMNAENSVLGDIYAFYMWNSPDQLRSQFIHIRKDLVFECINASKNSQPDATLAEIESLCGAYEHYLFWLIKDHIKNNRFAEIMQLLDDELEKCTDATLGTAIIWHMITSNNQFMIRSKSAIEQKIANHRYLIQDDKYSLIVSALKFSPSDIDLRDYTVEFGNYELSNIDFSKAKTLIIATVPIGMKTPSLCLMIDESTKIEFGRITNPLDDPIYHFLNDTGWNINGMPLAFLSDALQDVDSITLMVVTLNTFYHPDFEIVDDQIVHTDFSETDALLGRKYYPHKEKVIGLLRTLFGSRPSEFPLEADLSDININLISNYLVNYIDENDRSFFHKIYAVTTPDSFPKIRTKYLDKASKLNLSEEFLGVRELKFDSYIASSSSLCDFVFKAMEIIVKKSIEFRGVYRYLWEGREMNKPLSESSVQPLIKSHIQPTLEAKGIQISREVVAANGSIDYLCSFTKDDRLFKVGIEVKNAHHPNLLHGLTSQLPAYLDDEGTRDGIFIVLWYKHLGYSFPSEYNTMDELKSYLQSNVPQKYRIQVMLIDCTKKLAPSRK